MPASYAIVSLVSLIALAALLRKDNEATLLTTCPLEGACLPDRAPAPAAACLAVRALRNLWWLLLCMYLQLLWCVRAVLAPVLALVGTRSAFHSSKSAAEIVLNAVAIGFVFELDEFAYSQLLGKRRRTRFEEGAPPLTSPLAHGGKGRWVVELWCWLIMLCDTFYAIQYYLHFALRTICTYYWEDWYMEHVRRLIVPHDH